MVTRLQHSCSRGTDFGPIRLARCVLAFAAMKSTTLDAGHDIRERAFRFSCQVVRFGQRLHQIGGVAKEMAPQLLKAGTALYPMLEEARAAESRRDFISKCSIGLKEVREAHGRLRVYEACIVGPSAEATALRVEANELVAIMSRIVGNAKTNAHPHATPRPSSHS